MNTLPIEQKTLILSLLAEGNSLRTISRVSGVARNTISKLLLDAGEKARELLDREMINLSISKLQVDYVHELFEHRALIALSILLHEIEKTKDAELKELMKFVFTSSLAQASRLVPAQASAQGWTVTNYWVPPKYYEINVWHCFEQRFKKTLRGKEETQKLLADVRPGTARIHQISAINLRPIDSQSIDYIFTDPPYGESVPYFGMSLIWSSWLKRDLDFEGEILMREKSDKEKELVRYRKMLTQSFVEMFRVLKAGGWVSVTFHNRNIKIWNALVSAAFDAGFSYENDVYQLPPKVSAKAQLARSGSMTGDIYINFRKPILGNQIKAELGNPENAVITEAQEVISMRNGRATTDQIMRGVVSVLIKDNLLSKVENHIEDILQSNFVQVAKNVWALNEQQTYDPYRYIPLSKRLEYIIEGALSDGEPHTLDDVLVRIFTLLKNGKTPETKEIMDVLKKRAHSNGEMWISKTAKEPELFSPIEVEPYRGLELTKEEKNEHGWFIAQLAGLAYRMNLLPHVGKNEQNLDDVLQKLSIDRLEIAGLSEELIRENRIDQIDLIWLKDKNSPVALFEIENSTRGMNCIPRMGNLTLKLPHLRIPTYIVAPDKDEKVIVRQMTSISSQHIQGENKQAWKYVLYSDLLYGIDLFEKKKIRGDELLKRIARTARPAAN